MIRPVKIENKNFQVIPVRIKKENGRIVFYIGFGIYSYVFNSKPQEEKKEQVQVKNSVAEPKKTVLQNINNPLENGLIQKKVSEQDEKARKEIIKNLNYIIPVVALILPFVYLSNLISGKKHK